MKQQIIKDISLERFLKLEKYGHNLGVRNLELRDLLLEILPEKRFLQNITITSNVQYQAHSVPIIVPERNVNTA